MKKEVLFLLLNEYADWEGAYLASTLNAGVMPDSEVKYITKVVAPTLEPVCSIGGFRTPARLQFSNDADKLCGTDINRWYAMEFARSGTSSSISGRRPETWENCWSHL